MGKDICKPCPDDTWIADETNSDLPFKCEEYSCYLGKLYISLSYQDKKTH